MSLLAQSIGQIFEIEFCHILLFWAFFTLKSDPNYLQFKFHNLILYWAYDRRPKSFELMGSYIRVTYSKCVQGASLGKFFMVDPLDILKYSNKKLLQTCIVSFYEDI